MESLVNNLVPLMAAAAGGGDHGIGWNIFYYAGLVALTVFGYAAFMRRGLTTRVFIGLPAKLAEHLYLFVQSLALSVIGPTGKKYVPLLLAMWLWIFVANLFGLVLSYTPTADWSFNLSLAVIIVLYVQYEGIKNNGLVGHFRHFAGPELPLAFIWVSFMLFPVELISEVMKFFSLSLRLYGNIEGGHIVKDSLDGIVQIGNYGLPLGGLLLPIKFFTCVIQAFVFTMLSCVYLSIAQPHHKHADHGEVHAQAKRAA